MVTKLCKLETLKITFDEEDYLLIKSQLALNYFTVNIVHIALSQESNFLQYGY